MTVNEISSIASYFAGDLLKHARTGKYNEKDQKNLTCACEIMVLCPFTDSRLQEWRTTVLNLTMIQRSVTSGAMIGSEKLVEVARGLKNFSDVDPNASSTQSTEQQEVGKKQKAARKSLQLSEVYCNIQVLIDLDKSVQHPSLVGLAIGVKIGTYMEQYYSRGNRKLASILQWYLTAIKMVEQFPALRATLDDHLQDNRQWYTTLQNKMMSSRNTSSKQRLPLGIEEDFERYGKK